MGKLRSLDVQEIINSSLPDSEKIQMLAAIITLQDALIAREERNRNLVHSMHEWEIDALYGRQMGQ